MEEKDTRFRTFLEAFGLDTLALMSGPISVVFAIIALWVPNTTPKALFACLAAVSGIMAAFRVWRNERLKSNDQLDAKNAQIAQLTQELDAYRSVVDVSVKVGGTPPSQTIILTTIPLRSIKVSNVEYMTSDETAVAVEDVSLEGETVNVAVNYPMLQKVWATYRPDRNGYDHSGPAKVGLVLSIGNKKRFLVLPISMRTLFISNTNYIHIHGSKLFIEARDGRNDH